MTVRPATRYDEAAALAAWRACRVAAHQPPGATRVSRVRAKLRSADALSLVAESPDGAVVGMLLAELGRADDGSGPVVPGLLHLSMLFVHPSAQRAGHGGELVASLTARYPWVSVWTRSAAPFYERCGFVLSGRVDDGRVHLEHRRAVPESA